MVVVEVWLFVKDCLFVWVMFVFFGVIVLLIVILDFFFSFCIYFVFLMFYMFVIGNDVNKVVIVDVGVIFKLVNFF